MVKKVGATRRKKRIQKKGKRKNKKSIKRRWKSSTFFSAENTAGDDGQKCPSDP